MNFQERDNNYRNIVLSHSRAALVGSQSKDLQGTVLKTFSSLSWSIDRHSFSPMGLLQGMDSSASVAPTGQHVQAD